MSRSPLNSRRSMPGRNIAAPLGAGILVMVGTYALVGTSNDAGVVDEDLVPTVVVIEPIAAGTDTAVIGDLVEVRMLPTSVRPVGALSDLESLPAGVLAHDAVTGEQLLESSIALDEVDALGGGFTAISVRVDTQRWAGPYGSTGDAVDIYRSGETIEFIVADAVIISAPSIEELDPRAESIVTLAVPDESITQIISAASQNEIWMVGA
ncbi:MAG: hypothetical protein L7T83_04110 [Ilumatobacteraceae bacterium]|nr:hypothetical protein [Ilumatobacteraceae bacterium]